MYLCQDDTAPITPSPPLAPPGRIPHGTARAGIATQGIDGILVKCDAFDGNQTFFIPTSLLDTLKHTIYLPDLIPIRISGGVI